MLFYDIFYRKYGIRRVGQLLSPPLPLLEALELPRLSIFHYIGSGPLDIAPASDEFMFRHIKRPIMMMHVKEVGDTRGNPRKLPTPVDPRIRTYHNHNRRYKLAKTLEQGVRDQQVPFVINYGFLASQYRYVRSFYTEYNRWWNIAAAVWDNVGKLSEESDRNQFIVFKMPKQLPGLTKLRQAAAMESFLDEEIPGFGEFANQFYQAVALEGITIEESNLALESLLDTPSMAMESFFTQDQIALESHPGMTQSLLKTFNSPESLFLLELWKWAGPNRHSSLLSRIPDKHIDRVNLIFQESGKWTVLNLGVLNNWRIATEEELKANPDAPKKGLEPKQLQLRLVRMAMSLVQLRGEAAPEVDKELAQIEGGEKPKEGEAVVPGVVKQDVTLPTKDPETGAMKIATSKVEVPVAAQTPSEAETLPIETGADIKIDLHEEKQIEKDLEELDRLSREAEERAEEVIPEQQLFEYTPPKLEDGVMAVCNRLADDGMLSAAEYRRYQNLANTHKSIVAPDGKTVLSDFIQIPPHEIKMPEKVEIPDIHTVTDKTMLKSSLLHFDEHYIKNVMPKDVAGMVLNVQNAGVCVTGYDVERVEDISGSYDAYTVKVTPVEGSASTFRFKLPALEDDGTYMANGIKYRMRKQRGDLPIRKIAPDKVALTSYYGKIFAGRSEKRVNDYGQWLRNQIMAMGLDDESKLVTDLNTGHMFDNSFVCPRIYSTLAMGFRKFTINLDSYPKSVGKVGLTFDLDRREILKLFDGKELAKYERDGTIIAGLTTSDRPILIDKDDNVYVVAVGVGGTGEVVVPMGTVESLLGAESHKAPIDFAELKVLGKTIPIGVILAYEMGLETLIRLLKVTPRRVPAGQRLNLEHHEYPIAFSDETLVFSKDDKLATLVLAGFNEYYRPIRDYNVHEFDRRAVYLNILESSGITTRYLREIDLLYQMFVDPITRELLIEMKEPVDFRGLLIRSCQMLLSDQHPDELDPAFMRVKGYERMAGAVYAEIVKSLRVHNSRSGKSKHPIDLNPYAVWKAIAQDPSIALVQDINPIENLKDVEAVTFSGVGGRNSRSMTKHTRSYHPNDMGVISEATKDSSDVAINTYTSADPQFSSLRGLAKKYDLEKADPTALLSTSALISPASDRDDPKRVNFVSIQHGHGIACKGYRQSPVRTGYEQVIAQRTGDMFATAARKDGKVLSVSDEGIMIEYADGEKKGVSLGRRYGTSGGLTIPHSLVSNMKAGQKFKAGEIIAYNEDFFEPDLLNPNNVVWKVGTLVRTVLMESTITLEDSSAISKEVAELLTTRTTKIREIVVNFDQSVRKMVKEGDELEPEDILCIIEDAVTANNQLFDEETLDTLRVLGAQTPQAKTKGVVERIEVYYHGEKEDMSETLRSLANASDRAIAKRHSSVGKKAFTGSVDEGFRVGGDPLILDTMVIKIYITSDVPTGVGDKGVFANQLKTVFGQVMPSDIITESGKKCGAIFGAKSVGDRIVESPNVIGTTNTLLDVIGKKAVAAYKKG